MIASGMRTLVGASVLLAPGAAFAGPARAQVVVADVAGCYRVNMTVQSEATPRDDLTVLARWPRSFRLTLDRTPVPGIPVAFRAEAIDARSTDLPLVAWWTAVGDSIVVTAAREVEQAPLWIARPEPRRLSGRLQTPGREDPSVLSVPRPAVLRAERVTCPDDP